MLQPTMDRLGRSGRYGSRSSGASQYWCVRARRSSLKHSPYGTNSRCCSAPDRDGTARHVGPVALGPVRASVDRLANGEGAPRIHGEMLKLGIDVCQATIAKYMASGASRLFRLGVRSCGSYWSDC